ncbi:hypothetical protein V1291_004760 [Nitrobacteraceae bacterium AZCC 1564]
MTTQEQPAPTGKDCAVNAANYDKINGWLLIPAYLHPLVRVGSNIYASLQVSTLLATPGLSPDAMAYIVALLASCIVFGIAWGACGYFAYSLKPVFPKTYIWTSIADIVVSALFLGITYAAFGLDAAPDETAGLIKMILAAMIWIPYMLMSKRVKATFYGEPVAR